MGYERRNGDGALFKNERKQRENQPDYTGNCLINGVEMDIAAWVKEAKSTGKKFFSLSIKPRERDEDDGIGDFSAERGRGSEGRWGGSPPARSAPERGTRGGSQDSWGLRGTRPNPDPEDLPF